MEVALLGDSSGSTEAPRPRSLSAPAQAIRAITWVIGLIEDAVAAGRRPSADPAG